MKLFLFLLLEDDANRLGQVIERNLVKHFISLREMCWYDLHRLADQMYHADLISLDVQWSPTFDNVVAELTVELSLRKSISQIEQYCTQLLLVLTARGGLCAQVSQALQQDWIKDSRHECGVELQLGI